MSTIIIKQEKINKSGKKLQQLEKKTKEMLASLPSVDKG